MYLAGARARYRAMRVRLKSPGIRLVGLRLCAVEEPLQYRLTLRGVFAKLWGGSCALAVSSQARSEGHLGAD
jgi:hypothetical protein